MPERKPAIHDDLQHGHAAAQDAGKFSDAYWTAGREPRAWVRLETLSTLWFNTGTLCNIACHGCYIESSPRNDRLVYLTDEDVQIFLQEAVRCHPEMREIGITGGEPFMNPDIAAILDQALATGRRVLVLTNAMKPMRRHGQTLLDLKARFGSSLALRVSLDHYAKSGHEAIRGLGTWEPALEGLNWLSSNGFDLAVACRMADVDDEAGLRTSFASLFAMEGIAVDAHDPHRLVLFPEMDATADVPEISEGCWRILGKRPGDVMCAHSRMVIRRKGAPRPTVVSCTLLPYDERFEMGETLAQAQRPVSLNHPHCAKFCVLGGASCSS